MLLSICILFCDKDQHYIPSLLKNIKEKCQVKYEVVLIDNRKNKSAPLNVDANIYPCDKLGQWNGRRLAISKAKGDYIWFIDADDSINEVPKSVEKEFEQFYDIIAFNAINSDGELTGTWPLRKPEDRDTSIFLTPNLLTYEMEVRNGPCVWDKFYKRQVLLPTIKYEDIYLTYNEDSLFNMIALKNATNWRSIDLTLYNYNSADSQAYTHNLNDFSKFENLISSGQNLFKIRDKIFTSQEEIDTTYKWINKEMCVQFLNTRIYYSTPSIQEKEMDLLCQTYDKEFVESCIFKHAICEITKAKESRQVIIQKLISIWKKANNVSNNDKNASLAVCFNFCDKDFKYVVPLIKNIKENIFLENYEIIACDNRTKDNGKDEYIEGVKIWPCGGNTGPLGGRKEACKHITSDYVWYIDADDLINSTIGASEQEVLNQNYDYVSFKAIDDTGKTSGIWANTELYNDKEINNDDGYFFSYRTYLMTGAALWNKWVKTDVFKCILDIPSTTAVCYEDALCNSFIMKHSNRMFLYNKQLYHYRSNIGDANRQNIKKLESFKRTTNGGRSSLDIAKKIFTEKELFIMDAWFSELRYLEFSLKRVADSDESIQLKEIKDLLKYFSKEKLIEAIEYFTWYFEPYQVERLKKLTRSYIKEKQERKNIILTISIAFTDKDLSKIHELLWNIKEKIKIKEYEIILINNCLYNNKFIPRLNNITVIPSGALPNKNPGTYYTRQLGVKNAQGKYIWFIDADDKIINDFTEDDLKILNKNYDIVVFNSQKHDGSPTKMGGVISKNWEDYKLTLLSNKMYQDAGPCLWNKWIKVEKLKPILNTPHFAINAYEDYISVACAEKYSNSVFFYSKLFYQYDCSNSNTCSTEIKEKDLNRIFLGKENIRPLINMLFTKEETQNVYALSEEYFNNFVKSRQSRMIENQVKLGVLAKELDDKNAGSLISINENINQLSYTHILCALNKKIKSFSIEEFNNVTFTNKKSIMSSDLFTEVFLIKKSDFIQLLKGKRIILKNNSKNKIIYK